MDSTLKKLVTIRIVHSSAGHTTTHCPECHKILFRTKYSIILIDGGQKSVFFGDKKIECCGEKVEIPLGYDNKKSAEKARGDIVETVKRNGHLGGFKVHPVTPESGPTLQ